MIDSRWFFFGFALSLTMCGGGPPEPAAAPSNAPTTQGAPPPGYPGYSEPASPAASPAEAPAPAPADAAHERIAPAAPPPMVSGAGTSAPSREAQRAAAREELGRAERNLEESSGDCPGACRALASMSRAVAHLCGLVDSSDDRRRCDGAAQRLAAARERVKQSCGACPP